MGQPDEEETYHANIVGSNEKMNDITHDTETLCNLNHRLFATIVEDDAQSICFVKKTQSNDTNGPDDQ